MVYTSLNGALLKKMLLSGANELNKNKQLVDSLNVFPVPDGDTGTNMSLTVLSAGREVEQSQALDIAAIAKMASNGALRGARGNSGVILSQLFRGFAKGLEGLEEADVHQLAAAAHKGVETAYKAVMRPKEGTILTVARVVAESADKWAAETTDIAVFLENILADGYVILEQTKEMLPVLKQADVVDAGGRGLLYILEGALQGLGREGTVVLDTPVATAAPAVDFSALGTIDGESIVFGYCTEFIINVHMPTEAQILNLRKKLESLGDSLVLVADDDLIKIHVHSDHPGLVLETALAIGSLTNLKIENMREQHTSKVVTTEEAAKPAQEAPAQPPKKMGFIAVSAGDGLAEIFKNLGVDEVIQGGQTMNPSTEDILNAIEKINAENIVVLPNNQNIILAAEQAAALCENKTIFVVPSRSVPEGITAMIHYDDNAEPVQTVEAMKEALSTVDTGTLTYAVRDTHLEDSEIHEGDILGMKNGEIAVVKQDVTEAARALLDELIGDNHDMVSIYYGADVTEADAEALAAYVEEAHPDCDVDVQYGGQPLYYYIFSAE